LAFVGRISRTNELGLGHYELVIIASNRAGQGSIPASLSFTIAR
jgi:DNA-directed RNA polymerase subunit K/omega